MTNIRSILPKILMALTGLAWFVFLIGHLGGNFLLFVGADAFDAYAAKLESLGPLLIIAELLLIGLLATHVYSAIRLTRGNTAAREQDYAVKTTRGRATIASRTMVAGGVIVLVFVVTHVWMFKFGDAAMKGDTRMLHALVMEWFSNPLVVLWYVLAMLALGLHLSHGLGSAFQTLGIFSAAWRQRLWQGGVALGWVIAAGFISMPIWAFIAGQQ